MVCLVNNKEKNHASSEYLLLKIKSHGHPFKYSVDWQETPVLLEEREGVQVDLASSVSNSYRTLQSPAIQLLLLMSTEGPWLGSALGRPGTGVWLRLRPHRSISLSEITDSEAIRTHTSPGI